MIDLNRISRAKAILQEAPSTQKKGSVIIELDDGDMHYVWSILDDLEKEGTVNFADIEAQEAKDAAQDRQMASLRALIMINGRTIGRQQARLEQLQARIEQLEQSKDDLYNITAHLGADLAAAEARIKALELLNPMTKHPDFMAEFDKAAAQDDTPDAFDTGIVERPL